MPKVVNMTDGKLALGVVSIAPGAAADVATLTPAMKLMVAGGALKIEQAPKPRKKDD